MRIGKLLSSGLLVISFLIVFPSLTTADPLDNWHLRYEYDIFTGHILRAVTYADGIFVAVGENGIILSSPDGTTWTPRTSGTSMELNAVTYGNGLFVAVGDHGTLLISPDGQAWTPRTAYSGTTLGIRAIAYGNGIFVALGSSTVLRSPDGYTWTARTLTEGTYSRAVWFCGTTFVSVGTFDIFTSPDGVTWTKRKSQLSTSLRSGRGIAFGDGTIVAVGWYGRVWTSPDGIIWTERNSGTSEDFYAVAYGSNTFVAVGGIFDDVIFTSPDGIEWTQRNHGTSANPYGVTYGKGTFVAVGFDIIQSDPVSSNIFLDVPPDYWAEEYIMAIYNAHITTGYGDSRYGPEDLVTRDQMAAFIVRAVEGEPPSNYCDSGTPFPDVSADMWSCRYIKRLYELGITTGCGQNPLRYCPGTYVTRGQMAAFIIRAKYGENFSYSQTPHFTDVPATHNFFKYVQKLRDDGITAVTGTYGVDNIVTRAQMAAFLARAFLGMQ